jgi:hypothetical protein
LCKSNALAKTSAVLFYPGPLHLCRRHPVTGDQSTHPVQPAPRYRMIGYCFACRRYHSAMAVMTTSSKDLPRATGARGSAAGRNQATVAKSNGSCSETALSGRLLPFIQLLNSYSQTRSSLILHTRMAPPKENSTAIDRYGKID